MPAPLSGPGIGLQLPQYLYPTELNNAPYDTSSNRVGLSPGNSLVLPAGTWYVGLGMYLVLQFLDPVTNTWVIGASGGWEGSVAYVKSDGFNCRVANLTGCPVAAAITAYGGGLTQAGTTISVTGGGGSTWLPIVGGQLATAGTCVTGSAGAGYGVAPIALIPPPPPAANNSNGVGGVQASGYFGISSGTISGFTFTNPGAGYPTAPVITAVPSPFDPNLSTGITAGTITCSVVGSGSLCGVLCTNNGAPLANPANITLTVNGGSTAATIVPVVMQTVTAVSVVGTSGTGWGTLTAGITSIGGAPSVGTVTNGPDYNHRAFKPRPLQASVSVTGTGTLAAQVGTIIDGGLFENAPTPLVISGAGVGSGYSLILAPSVVFTMGSSPDVAVIQPAP